jgi:hypothetical protein
MSDPDFRQAAGRKGGGARVSDRRSWFDPPCRLAWPADLWWPLNDDELGSAIAAVHVAATTVIAHTSGYRVGWLSATIASYPGTVALSARSPSSGDLGGWSGAVVCLAGQAAIMRYLSRVGHTMPGRWVLTNHWTRHHTFGHLFIAGESEAISILLADDDLATEYRLRGQALTVTVRKAP